MGTQSFFPGPQCPQSLSGPSSSLRGISSTTPQSRDTKVPQGPDGGLSAWGPNLESPAYLLGSLGKWS